MHKTVIDIETVGLPLETFEERFHDKLTRWFDPGPAGSDPDEERRAEAVRRFSLWGATGRVVVIGMHNPDTDQSRMIADQDEAAMLREFWDLVKPFDLQITFNGKNFDFPFLQMRSALNGVEPSRTLDCRRFSRKPHLDLREILTNFGSQRFGSLDFFCSIFGIPSPKEGLSGEQVGEAYHAGRLDDIIEYCRADVAATAELYRRVRKAF